MTDDTDELKSRVEQLEDQVQSQQETIKKMLPDRRQTLKGVGLLAGGGILGGLGGSASASTGSAGQIGTSTDRPDIFGDAADLNSVDTNDQTINQAFGYAQNAVDPANTTEEFGANVQVSANSWYTIFDIAGENTVLGGVIFGQSASGLRVTDGNGDTVVVFDPGNTAAAVDGNVDNFGVLLVPPLKNVSKLELYNSSGSSRDYGWKLLRT